MLHYSHHLKLCIYMLIPARSTIGGVIIDNDCVFNKVVSLLMLIVSLMT